MAKEFEFKTYFLSWSLDWRGRFYSQQTWLTPLSTDFEKSLIPKVSEKWRAAALGIPY